MDFRGKLKAFALGLLFIPWFFAPVEAAESWIQVRSKNFFLIGDAGEKEIRQSAARLEQFRETFRILFPQIKLDGGIRTNVVVFKNAASYAPFKPKRPDTSIDSAVAGYFQPGEDVNYITLSVGDKTSAYGTIFHEYVHFLLDVNIGRSDLPPWLGEGLAEYYETLQFLDDRRIVLGVPPNGHLSLLRQNELIPFKTFFATDNFSLHQGGDESRSLFYAQAWALTHYLFQAEADNSGSQLNKFLTFLKNKDVPEKAFSQLFYMDYASVEKELRKYIDQDLPPNRIVSLTQKLDFEAAMSAAPLPESQMAAYLGDLHFHTGNLTEAEVFLRKALTIDSNSGIANMSLGLVLAQKKNFVEAKKYLEKAIASDRTNHFAYFNYAYTLTRENMDANGNITGFSPEAESKMREALLRAIALNPNFAESYRLLAFVNLVNDTDLDESVDLLKKGLAIRPGDQDFSLLLAQVFLHQEKYEEAKLIAEKLAGTASDANVWAEAQSVLRTVHQYHVAKAAGANESGVAAVFGPLPPLILQRSAISDADAERYVEDRLITNLNLFIERPRFGEKQIVGYVERITCREGQINYAVRSGGGEFNLVSNGFDGLRLRVLTDGERAFTLDCDVSLGKQLTVMIFQPSANSKPNISGRLLSISFVPDFFRLKTAEEMANRRTVIIEDDRIFKSRPGKTAQPKN